MDESHLESEGRRDVAAAAIVENRGKTRTDFPSAPRLRIAHIMLCTALTAAYLAVFSDSFSRKLPWTHWLGIAVFFALQAGMILVILAAWY
jgi:hypothetical protein